jgi:hypothetical protein
MPERAWMLYREGKNMRKIRSGAALIALSLLLAGCGLGGASDLLGGGNPLTAILSLVISWQLRSRDVNAPASALSAKLVLKGANPSGGDFVFTFDRDSNLSAHSQTYIAPLPALAGTWDATVTFYAGQGGQGNVVGVASKQVTVIPVTSNLGDIATTGTITSVTLPTGQSATVGTPKDLIFTAKDANGNTVAVTPGSAVWTVVSGSDKLQVTSNGQLLGLAPGTASVTVSVDGKVSPATGVAITSSPTQ